MIKSPSFLLIANQQETSLVLVGKAPHEQVTSYFCDYNTNQLFPDVDLDYRSPTNVVGHQQRAFVIYWALRGFTESGFVPGIDLGGAGVPTPGCISVDIVASGESPVYGGQYNGVHIKADASKMEGFGKECFSSIVSNHLIEHLDCAYFHGTDQQQRKAFGCKGQEIIKTLELWVDLLKPGGYVAGITPDEKWTDGTGNSFFAIDPSHQHAFDSRTFREEILQNVRGATLIQYDTFNNHFSFDFVLRKD